MGALAVRLGRHTRRGRTSRAAVLARSRVLALTDARTGIAHRVTDDAFAVARRAGSGRYLAVCGVEVISASLTVPEGRQCRSCAAGVAG